MTNECKKGRTEVAARQRTPHVAASLRRDASQLRCGALPVVLALDKDIRESKFSANFISCIAALYDCAAGNHGGIVIDIYHLVVVGNRFVGRRVGLDAIEILGPA